MIWQLYSTSVSLIGLALFIARCSIPTLLIYWGIVILMRLFFIFLDTGYLNSFIDKIRSRFFRNDGDELLVSGFEKFDDFDGNGARFIDRYIEALRMQLEYRITEKKKRSQRIGTSKKGESGHEGIQ